MEPRLLHGCLSTISLQGFAVMLMQPFVLLWPRLRVASLLLACTYQMLSSLSSVLGMPLPQRAWSLIEFVAPFANLDITLFPKIGCGLTYYQALYMRGLSIAVLVAPAWLLWLIRTQVVSHALLAIAKKRGKGRLMQAQAAQLMSAHSLVEFAVGWTFNVVTLAHPSVTRTLLQLYDCRVMDNGSSHLVVDVSVTCTTARVTGDTGLGPMDSDYSLRSMIGYGILGAWCGLLPLLVALQLASARKLLKTGQKHPWSEPFCGHCKPSCYMWEVYSVLARALLAGGLVLLERGSAVQPAVGAAFSALLLAVAARARPLDSGGASSLPDAPALFDTAKQEASAAQTALDERRAALKAHLDSDDAKEHRDELTWKQRRIAARILRPHIVPAAGLRQFDRTDYDRKKDNLWKDPSSKKNLHAVALGRAWVPQRMWNRDKEITEAEIFDGLKLELALKEQQDRLYVIEEINRAFEKQAEDFPVPHGVGISLNPLAVCLKRYRRDDVRDYAERHLLDFVKESQLRTALDEAVAAKHRTWYQQLRAKRRLNPPGAHGGRLANAALIVCTATVFAAYVLCYVLRGLQHAAGPDVPKLQAAIGDALLAIQVPPIVVLAVMVFAPLIADFRRSNAARLASSDKEEQDEERDRGDDADDDDEVVGEDADDDEAADIKRLRDKRSQTEGGRDIGARPASVADGRQGRKIEP
jgi:hypothetical protein